MGKTRSAPKERIASPSAVKIQPLKSPRLTKEQQTRLDAFKAFVKRGEEQWAAMTPEERREEEEGWKRAMKRMNDDREGYRKLFINDNFD